MKWMKESDQSNLTQEIGPSVTCTLREIPADDPDMESSGFEIKLSGSFRSGNGLNETMEEIIKAWKTIDIDAA
jgi:hypothetical protein